MREFKRTPLNVKDITGRTVVGIAAVMGNIDDIDDRIHPGAFVKTIQEGRDRIKHLWNHSFGQPPIATIKSIQEVGRDSLPANVLSKCPEATGGLEVGREYYKGVDLADWVFSSIKAGDVTEMSFGFDAVQYAFTEEGEGGGKRRIRELTELRLYDTSDVLWGMNSATVANAKAAGLALEIPLELIAQEFAYITQQLKAGKAGARNAATDLALIRAIHAATLDLGCDSCLGIKNPETDENGKAGTAPSETRGIPLSDLRRKLDFLTLSGK